MDDNNIKIQLNNNNIKYFNTEENKRPKNRLSISPIMKEKLHRLNYKLYKFNELNRKHGKNNLLETKKKDLFSNIIIKNYNKKNYIKNLYQLNTDSESIDYNNNSNKCIKTLNNFHAENNISKNTGKANPKSFHRNKFYSFKKNNYLPKMTFSNYSKNNNKILTPIKKEKENLCLVPIYQLYKNKFNNIKNKHKSNVKNKTIFKNNSYYNKNIYTKLKNKWKNRMKKGLLEKLDENDMKPKIRFINLQKELLEQTLKINKMFVIFKKQIKEKEKNVKFIGKFKYKKNQNNDDILNNNF